MKVAELFEASNVAKAAKAAKLAKKFKLTYIKGYGMKSGDSKEFTLADAHALGFDKDGIAALTKLGQGETETFGGYQDKLEVKCLSEAYTPPVKNPKLAFRSKGEKVPAGSGKQGIPIGGTKEWLKAFGATSADINQALRVVRQSAEFRAVKALGMSDESTDRHNTLGSMALVGFITMPTGAPGKTRDRRVKVTVQANGKMDETSTNDFHRAPLTSPKPRIVPGDAVSSIAKTMQASLAKLAATIERRKTQAAADIKKSKAKSFS